MLLLIVRRFLYCGIKEIMNHICIAMFCLWLLQNVQQAHITKIINQFRIGFDLNENVILPQSWSSYNSILYQEKSKQHHC